MEKIENKNQRAPDADFLVQWGNRKRLRALKVKKNQILEASDGSIPRRAAARVVRAEKDAPFLQPNCPKRNSDASTFAENGKSHSSSPDKEDRCYTTRGSVFEEGVKLFTEGVGDEKGFVWPRFSISLSCKEKEEDFMAMKGCKLPQRPKKRAKFIQKNLLLVSPGAWLSDLSQERYEVREKKSSSKRRPTGLKAMRSMETDSG